VKKVKKCFFPTEILCFRFGLVITGGCASPLIAPGVFLAFRTMPRVAQSASHQHSGTGGMFGASKAIPGNTETEPDDNGGYLWESHEVPSAIIQ
jgi:hypothetical protein